MPMPAINSQTVLIPALLFLALSPGLLLQLPTAGLKLNTMKTDQRSVLLHSLVLMLALFLIFKFVMNQSFKQADLVVPAILFILLSPGMLLNIPPLAGGKFWMTKQTTLPSIAVHTLVFAVVYAVLRAQFPSVYY